MALIQPDPTFYPSAREAMLAPREELAYVALSTPPVRADLTRSPRSTCRTGQSSACMTCPSPVTSCITSGGTCAARPCARTPRTRMWSGVTSSFPVLRSSRIYVFDVKDDPWHPKLVKTIEPETIFERTGYSRPHTVHCGTDAIYVSALGNVDGDAPGGVFTLDHDTFEPKGRWEANRGPQELHYDFWWHLGHDRMVTSEWGTPNQIEAGPSTGAAGRPEVRSPVARLGPVQAQAPSGDRPGRPAPDGPGAPSRP